MKGCKNCGCTEFFVDGKIYCQGIVDITEDINIARAYKPDELDFEKDEESVYTCKKCDTEYTYEKICEMAGNK